MTEHEEEAVHGPDGCHYDNLRQCCGLCCGAEGCNFVASGDTWEEAGADMDEHIKEMSP